MSEASNTVFLTDRQNIMPDRRKSAKNALSIFLTVFALMIAVTAVILFVSGEAEMKTYQNMERHTVDIQADNIDRDILQVSSDLKILAHGRNMDGLWGDDGIPISNVLDDLTDDFLNVSMYRGLYDQVRLLDENGMEIGRVNFNGGLPAIVPQDKLQNKKGRYYFDDAFKLSMGEVFISPLDLNIEHGEIELPLKPMIRFATPVFDRLGKKRGIVLLNYFGAKLLDRFSSQAETSRKSRTMLLNTDGYWLYGPNSEDEWGFMYEDRKDRTLANACPEAWKRIKSEESCQFETPQGMFTSKTVYPLLEVQKSNSRSSKAYSRSLRTVELNEYYWKVVSFVPSDVLYAHRNNRRSYAALVLALLSVTSLLGSWRVAKVVALRRQAEEEIKILAKFPAEDPNPVLRISKDGTVIYHNRSSEPLLEHWHYKDGKPLQDGWLQFALDALQDDDIKTVETEIGDKILSLTFAPISEKGFVNVYGLDITERKKTEHELRKLSTAVEQSPATVVITDIEGTIQYVNPSFTETTGYTSEEVIGQNPRILKSGDMPPDVYRQMWEAIRAGTVWRGEFHNIKKNGDFFWEAASISPIRDATGAITNFLAVKEDITDRKQAEIALTKSRDELESINEHLEQQTVFANEMAAQAEMANTAKSEFLANMSHEIRTPMNGVIGMTGLLLDTDLNDKQRRYAEAVRASGEALLSLINDILDFSKIESGKLEMETLDFDLHALLDDFAEMLALKAHDKGLEFLCGVAPETPAYLRGDPGRLRQILINLAGNAVKFTHDGEIAVLASLEAESNEDVLVRFLVRDTGIGIPVDNQDSIFHQFTQVDASTTRKYGGTGLGLAISKQLVEMMGGEIGVNSKEGLGSEFWFTARFLKQPEQERDLTPPADMHGVRILVVDDNATNREILMVKFKAWGGAAGRSAGR